MTRCVRGTIGWFKISLVALLTVVASLVASPPAHAGMNDAVQLLTRNVGWQESSGRLFWTNNGGATWIDISPKIPSVVHGSHGEQELQEITSVFFLNTHVGWTLYSHPDFPDASFTLAYTTDSGRNWTIWPLQLPSWKMRLPIAPGASIAFADRLNGWMEAQPPHSSASRSGVLLMTADGGRTWKFAPTNPGSPGPRYLGVGGAILVRSPKEVWLAGGVSRQDLYVTRDGAKSWRKISLPAPSGLYPARIPTYGLPIFKNKKDGYEVVTYATLNYGPGSPGNGGYGRSAAVLFVTKDGGRTWKADRIVTNLTRASPGQMVTSTVTGDEWILGFTRPLNRNQPLAIFAPLLLKVGPGQRIKASGEIASANWGLLGLSFVNPMVGLTVGGGAEPRLTTDGGASWRRSSPFPKLHFHIVTASPPTTERPAP